MSFFISPKNEVDLGKDHGKYNRDAYFPYIFSQPLKRKRSDFVAAINSFLLITLLII